LATITTLVVIIAIVTIPKLVRLVLRLTAELALHAVNAESDAENRW